jgi:DNA-binding beta-propeller fold protein YncE
VLSITAAVLSAVLLAVAVVLARDRGAPTGPTTPAVVLAADRAVRLNPSTYEPDGSVAVGTEPSAVIGGGGLVWVASRRDGTVSVVDPDTDRVQVTMPPSGSGPVGQGGPGLAYASGSLWVANTVQRQVVRVEPDAEPTALIPVRGASPNAIVAAQDVVWVAARTERGRGLVARIDAGSNRVDQDQTVMLRHPPTGLAITPDGGTVWVATPADRAVHRIDTDTGRVKRIELPETPDQAAYGDGAVWVTSTKGNTVMRIDAAGSKAEPIPVGNGPGGIAFGADRVWVANRLDGTISAIDPQTNEVGTRRLGFRPTAVAVMAEQRAVWVALAG